MAACKRTPQSYLNNTNTMAACKRTPVFSCIQISIGAQGAKEYRNTITQNHENNADTVKQGFTVSRSFRDFE
jgi:hypothetical protein